MSVFDKLNKKSVKDTILLGSVFAGVATLGVGLVAAKTLIMGGALAYFTGMPLAKACGIYLGGVGLYLAAQFSIPFIKSWKEQNSSNKRTLSDKNYEDLSKRDPQKFVEELDVLKRVCAKPYDASFKP